MPSRFKLTVAYDGTPFAGWQSQAGGNTIQDLLEKAIGQVAGTAVRVHGAGRTDAGVHALAQCAHIDLAAWRLSPQRLAGAINAYLPATIRVMRAARVPDSFHARFSAKGKIYRYRIWNGTALPPLEVNRAWHVASPLRLPAMIEAAGHFTGQHDFAAFAANRGKPGEDTRRTIRRVRVSKRGDLITLLFDGEGFLYKMARLMTGGIVQAGLGKIEPAEIAERLRSPSASPSRVAAPAAGLFLVRVRY